MRSAASAIAWEFRQRQRWGLAAILGYLVVLATLRSRIHFDDAESFALLVLVPTTSTFLYLLAVFSFGLSGDLAARQSMYPARLFTLPVTTAALAAWPMLYGAVSMMSLWLLTRLVAVWPAAFDMPVLWPAVLGPSLLAWTQALVWMPYALPGLRVMVTVVWLTVIDAIVLVAIHFQVSEAVMVAILAPQVPLAYLAARFAVGRARRGDVPDWRDMFAWVGHRANVLPRLRSRFPSAAHAQRWFEWRRHGRSLPALVSILLPFELVLLFLFRDTPVIVFEVLLGVLLTPSFMAAFVAATVSNSGSESLGVAPFMATRPMTSASLVAAKLKATARSTLVTWLLVLAAIPIALRLSDTSVIVAGWFRGLAEALGTPRAVALVLLGLLALLGSTWKQLVQSLCIGMSGREWLVKASVFAALSLLAVILPLGHRVLTDNRAMVMFWKALPATAAAAAGVKLVAAAWIAVRLYDRGVLSNRTLVLGAASWAGIVFALYGAASWIFPPLIIRSDHIALAAILIVPLARLSAAPLALAWNRHR